MVLCFFDGFAVVFDGVVFDSFVVVFDGFVFF